MLAITIADTAGAQGETATPTTTAAPATREGIADAKKEFETVKAMRGAASFPGDRPKIATPELALPTAPSPLVSPKAKSNPRDAKSPNWLVDALEKNSAPGSGQTDARARDRRGRPASREREDVDANRGGRRSAGKEDDAELERDRGIEREDAGTLAAANPLNDFLGAWMTPHDYALLKPSLTAGHDAPTGVNGMAMPAASVGSTTGVLSDLTRTGSIGSSAAIPPPRENPYLQSLRADMSPPPPVAPRQTAAPVLPPSPAPVVVPTPGSPSSSKVPEFAKPSPDDRYFKQLKRF